MWGLWGDGLEVVGSAYGQELRGETVGGKAEPILVFEVGTSIKVRQNLIVETRPARQKVVSEIGVREAGKGREVKDAATVHHLSIGFEPPVSAMIAPAYLIGLFVDVCPFSVLDKVEGALDAEVVN